MSRFNKKKDLKTEKIASKVTPELKEKLVKFAKKHNTTVSKVIGALIEEELERDEESDRKTHVAS